MINLLLHITANDIPYLPLLKPILSGRSTTHVDSTNATSAYEFILKAKKLNCIGVVTTDPVLLRLLLPEEKNPTIDAFAGSIIEYKGCEFLIIDPIEQLVTVNYGKFVTTHFLSKFLEPENWLKAPPFDWELFDPALVAEYLEFFSACDAISIDIETIRDDPDKAIECISFTGVMLDDENICFRTIVVPCDSIFNVYFIRRTSNLSPPKILQNGKYDIAYLMRYGCPIRNYCLDTINLFHSWLCELPKDLGFIAAMTVRNYAFHKNESGQNGKYSRYAYNAKDTYYTALSALALLLKYPDYSMANYLMEFPVTFPCILCEHTGIRYDEDRGKDLKGRVEVALKTELRQLRIAVANPYFNPSSSQQVVKLISMLGSKDILSSNKAAMDKFGYRHPLNSAIALRITEYRSNVKLATSYFKDGVSWNGRVMYALNPFGTDTGRLASRESQFWCGLQIQNIPSDEDAEEGSIAFKETLISDSEFYLGEADYSQAEARGTSVLSGDTSLIETVEDKTRDSHGINASKFFGMPYEQIVKSYYDDSALEWVHKKLNKPIRYLSKRVTYGAFYNMGPGVLLETMGIKKVLEAKKILNLPNSWSLIKVTTYLLDAFAKAYPVVKGPWYDKCVNDVQQSGYLVGPTGWTRKCFGKPRANKRDLNAIVAHPPQSLNAMMLNKAFLAVFHKVYLPNSKNFKLHAQIHDSILFSYRIGYEHLAVEVKKCMDIPITVIDTFGIRRELIVPVDLKGNATRWSDVQPLKV